jgi:chemotaxis protein CheD
MISYTLNIGDVCSDSSPAEYKCYGLGSCIGVFVTCRLTGASAGAHIALPESPIDNIDGIFPDASSAIGEMLQQLRRKGSNLQNLRAKMAGGATVIGSGDIGERNSNVIREYLVMNRIFVAANHTGGTASRSLTFKSDSGELTMRLNGTNETRIL